MDREEARAILAAETEALRAWSYDELLGIVTDPTRREVVAPSGTKYYVTLVAIWRDKKGGPLEVIVGVNDGGLLATLRPVSGGLSVETDGSVEVV